MSQNPYKLLWTDSYNILKDAEVKSWMTSLRCYKRIGKRDSQGEQALSLRIKKNIYMYRAVGCSEPATLPAWTTLFRPFQLTFWHSRKTRTLSNLHQRLLKKAKTSGTEADADRGTSLSSGLFWKPHFKPSCRTANMTSFLLFSVVCMTASWGECDQPVNEEYGKGRRLDFLLQRISPTI